MKYVLMFTSRPDLSANVDPELSQAIYKKVYEWFGENGDKFADNGAELLGIETATTSSTATTARSWSTARSTRPRRSSAASASSTSRTWTPPSPWSRRGRSSSCPAWRSRSGRWSRTTASSSDRPPEHDRRLLARTLREESGLLVARLARQFRDFDLAEEAVQSAVTEALESWRRDGPPDNPAAWLQTAARHNALDLVRRRTRQDALAHRAEAGPPTYDGRSATDDRLALLFACCHPALAPEARLALTLRAVVGMTTPQIARAFLVNERTLAQRIVRAKRKIVSAGIALTVPADEVLTERLSDVLAVIALMYNEGFVSSDGAEPGPRPRRRRRLAGRRGGDQPARRGRGVGAGRVAHLPARPGERPLLRAGELVLLPDQDRSRWDRTAIAAGEDMLERAAALHAPAPSSCGPRSRPATRPARRGPRRTGSRSWPSSRC